MKLFRIHVTSVAVVAVLFVLAGAAAPPPATQRLPIVIITKIDGTTARGQLVSADPDHVVVRANDKSDPQPPIPWSAIKRMSNGLTQAAAFAAWKEQHKDELCDTCHGDRVTKCSSCFGGGVDQAKLVACDACEGTGITSVCNAPKCNGTGKIDCPKPCLKLTQGTWRMRDGKRWRDISVPGRGTGSVSEGHLGELIDMKTGGLLGPCPNCGGTTKVDCPTCDGLGVMVCPKCDFAGATGPPCPKCAAGNVACTTCAGKGLRPKQ